MIFPSWTPTAFQEKINDYHRFIADGNSSEHPEIEAIRSQSEMWTRLMTRPEMEDFWKFVFSKKYISVFAEPKMLASTNGGMVAKLNRYVNAFNAAPILSPQEYKDEMLEISRLAARLSAKLKKFCDADFLYNPFLNRSLFTSEQVERFGTKAINPKFFENKRGYQTEVSMTRHLLDDYLPPITDQLQNLALRAKSELDDPHHRLPRLPRKVGDANVFRTYFISVVRHILLLEFADGSHARLATFCSVALDDPGITAELVRRIAPLDGETKEFLKQVKEHNNPED